MIHVIASVRVKPGKISDFLEIFKSNVPLVKAEKGCIRYLPTIDLKADLPIQTMDEEVVTVIETWESIQALRDHLSAPHMVTYRQRVSGIVENVTLKVLQEV